MSTKTVMKPMDIITCDICGKEVISMDWVSANSYILSYEKEDRDLDMHICGDCKAKYGNIIRGELRAKLVETFNRLKESHNAE